MSLPGLISRKTLCLSYATGLSLLFGCGKISLPAIPFVTPAAPAPVIVPVAVPAPTGRSSSVVTTSRPAPLRAPVDLKEIDPLEAPYLADVQKHAEELKALVASTAPASLSLDPLPQAPDAITYPQLVTAAYEWRLQDVAAYKTSTIDPPTVRDIGWKFLQDYMGVSSQIFSKSPPPELFVSARAAEAAGCQDPLIKLHLASIRNFSQLEFSEADRRSALAVLRGLADEIQTPKYTTGVVLQYHVQLHALLQEFDRPAREQHRVELRKHWAKWLASCSQNPEIFQYAWTKTRAIHNDWDLTGKRDAYLELLRTPDINPWFVHMYGGELHHAVAFKYRGSGWASTVSDEGWQKLGEHNGYAFRHLLRAWQLQPRNAEAPAEIMSIALTNDEIGSSQEWFLRTIAVQFDHFNAYSTLNNALRPRWGGSLQEMRDLAVSCLESDRFDTDVPSYGLWLLNSIQTTEMGLQGDVLDHYQPLNALRRLGEELVKRRPDASTPPLDSAVDRPEYRSLLAAFLSRKQQYVLAGQVLRPVAHQPGWDAHRKLYQNEEYATGLALAAVPELLPQVKWIDRIVQDGATAETPLSVMDQALTDLKSIETHYQLSDKTLPLPLKSGKLWNTGRFSNDPEQARLQRIHLFVLHATAIVQRQRSFFANEWVELKFDPYLSGFEPRTPELFLHPEGTLEFFSEGETGFSQLVSLTKFSPPYDVQMTVRVKHTDPEKPWEASHLGILAGYSSYWHFPGLERNYRFFNYSSSLNQFRVSINEQSAEDSGTKNSPPYGVANLLSQGSESDIQIRIKIYADGRHQAQLNNLLVLDSLATDFKPAGGLSFGEIGNNGYWTHRSIRLRELRIRRLQHSPGAPGEISEATATAAREQLANDPQDAVASYELGKYLLEQGDARDALARFEHVRELNRVHDRYGILYYIGRSHFELDHYEQAITAFREQLAKGIAPGYEGTISNTRVELAHLLATAPVAQLRNGEEAVKLVEPFSQAANHTQWNLLWILAAAHAEAGDFTAAKRWITQARVLAPAEDQPLLEKIEQQIQAGKPYHYPAPKQP